MFFVGKITLLDIRYFFIRFFYTTNEHVKQISLKEIACGAYVTSLKGHFCEMEISPESSSES